MLYTIATLAMENVFFAVLTGAITSKPSHTSLLRLTFISAPVISKIGFTSMQAALCPVVALFTLALPFSTRHFQGCCVYLPQGGLNMVEGVGSSSG